jgi:magnesium chelatase subunit H
MRDDRHMNAYRVVIVTLDRHAAGPAARVTPRLQADFPGITVDIFAAAEWGNNPAAFAECEAALREADIVIANLLFLEEHVAPIMPHLLAARARCDAFVGMITDGQIVRLTKMGDLDMSKPASAAMQLLKSLRGSKGPSAASGEKQMKMLRRLPKILRFLPGKAQDLRAWFLSMQYWLGGSDDNIEQMLRFLVSRYATGRTWAKTSAKAPIDYPDVGLYHPALRDRITTRLADLPRPAETRATVGLLVLRSYVLADDRAHYDAVIAAFEAQGLAVVPAFAGGLDGRPAIEAYFQGPHGPTVDAMVSLTGFSLVGGPAYNDSPAAVAALRALDVPYVAAHPLEFQTLAQWAASGSGLGPVETTMLIALPEIDGATNPTVFAGRHGTETCTGCARRCAGASDVRAMAPCPERIGALAEQLELGLCVKEVCSAELFAIGNDAAHRLDHILVMRVEKRPDRGVTLGHQRTAVEQLRRLLERRKVQPHGRAAHGLQALDGLGKCSFGQRVAKELELLRHTKHKAGRKSLVVQWQCSGIRVQRIVPDGAFKHLRGRGHRARKYRDAVHALRSRQHAARADQPA